MKLNLENKPISRVFFSHYEEERGMNKCEYLYELWYWLMSLSQTKRIGVYLPFKTNKNKEEAVKRLIGDCKKFGVKFSSYFEEHELLFGYGESVWYLVDDLLNRELIRRDYKFGTPVIKDDSDDEFDDLEEAKVEDHQLEFEDNTLINNSNSPSKRNKVIVRNANIIESEKVTRTNFFTADSVSRTQPDEDNYNNYESNESMISWKIDPDEWYNEVEKVRPQLTLIEKEQYKIEYDPIEEFVLNLDKTSSIMKDIKSQSEKSSGLQLKFNKVINKIDDDLDYIK